MSDALSKILEAQQAERLATGFGFTEGPLWHPDGFYYFVDIRANKLFRVTPGKAPEVVRENTGEGNGTTFDLQGRLVMCEGSHRRVTRMSGGSGIEVLVDRYEGKRLNRPNDVVCKSDGSLWFTDPDLRVPFAERELPYAGVYRIAPDGTTTLMADCEYPNGLAFSPDQRFLYVIDGAKPDEVGFVVEHELVHALQDQYISLDSVQKIRDDNDRLSAAQSVFEGQAVYEQISIMLGGSNIAMNLPGGWDRIREMIRENQASMPIFAAAPKVIQETLIFPYLSGAEFYRNYKERKPGSIIFQDVRQAGTAWRLISAQPLIRCITLAFEQGLRSTASSASTGATG